MKNANARNNRFASPDTQTDASACKRVVFLPTHPSPPTTLTQYEWISREKQADNGIKFEVINEDKNRNETVSI